MTELLESTSFSIPRRKTTIALLALLPVLIIFAGVPILIKMGESEINANTIVFNRTWIAAIVLLSGNEVWSIRKKQFIPSLSTILPRKENILLLLVLLAFFSVSQQLLYAWSLTQTSAANSEILHSLTPLFITLVGSVFLNQKFEPRFLLGMAIAILGSIALTVNDFSIALDRLQGDGLALISAMLWGGYILILEKLKTQLSINAITSWTFPLQTIFLLPLLFVFGDRLFPYSWQVWLIVITMGIVEILAKLLLTYSLQELSSGLVSTILLLHPSLTAFLAWGILSETLSWLNILAFIVILLGVYLATSGEGGIKITEEQKLEEN